MIAPLGPWGDQPINWGAPSRPLAWLHVLAPSPKWDKVYAEAMRAWEHRCLARVRELLGSLTRAIAEAYRANGMPVPARIRWRYFDMRGYVLC